ncbi:PEP/pyruvate-binding domain-containing protein [Anaeromyxobacter terrae]|uniref:PEP/pyruvate-binding domain-containing protein n=1 Tax=Anaeromyxobacter terrae TaxID=2925406 RepID=UPI001F5603B8|nr:PEP/pyruvate-binding domain-containing protein [Anaeromyxobacter sp. SG22]
MNEAPATGAKGANLAALIRLGMPVPGGFVVTTDAYEAHAARCGLAAALAPGLARKAWAEVEAAARALLTARPIDEPLRTPVLEAYRRMGSPAVAVRSSATAEDLAGASFAGQHDTFLQVEGDDALLRTIAACWASLWGERVLRYREQRAVDHASVRIAVVVQRMVRADAAGVLFTVDPMERRADRMVVQIAPGPGEAVVSGAVTGEAHRIDRATGTLAGSGGDHLLTAEGARELWRFALELERHFGCPQDLEFAVAGGALYLLQARPITTLGTAEPEPLPPLGKPSFVDGVMRRIAAERYVVAPRPLDNITFTRLVGAAMYALGRLGGTIRAEDAAAFRAQIWRQAYRFPPVHSKWRFLFSGWSQLRALRVDWEAWWEGGPREALRAASAPVDLTALGDAALLQRAEQILAVWEDPLNRRFHAASSIEALWWLRLVVALVVGRRRRGQIMAHLLSGLETPTEEVNEALWQLSRLARSEPALRAAVRDVQPEAVPATPAGLAFREALRAFLEGHGHREGSCYYLSTPTWRHDPLQVWRLLASLVEVDTSPADPRRARARYEDARALVERRLRFVPGMRRLFEWLVDRFRAAHAFRERSHYDITRPLSALQDVAAEWGRRLTERGLLGSVDDVYYLTHEEVRSWLLDSSSAPAGVRELVSRRRATYPIANARWQVELCAKARRGALRGIAASPGVARGRARLIRGEHEFDRLRPGEVLVCPYSNPAWTPLFVSASAVIAETGGVASHAAIVAREYGIPAVMSVPGVTGVLHDGDEVLVDGDRGTVVRPRARRGA